MPKTFREFTDNQNFEIERDKVKQKETEKLKNTQAVNDQFTRSVEAAKSQTAKGGTLSIYQNVKNNVRQFRAVNPTQASSLGNGWLHIGNVTDGNFQGGAPKLEPMAAGVNEALSVQGRKALKRKARQNKTRLKMARRKAKNKTATRDVIAKRARRRARKKIMDKFMRGKPKKAFSNAQLNRIKTMVDARTGQLDALRRSILPNVRADDKR